VRAIDVSMPLFEGMPAFPGDPPFRSEPLLRVGRGEPYDLSQLTLGSHAGTHIDPPSHFFPGAPAADAVDLSTLCGEAFVLEAATRGRAIVDGELDRVPPGTHRLLLKTPNSARWARRLEFFEDFVGLEPAGAERLLARGVRLVGIDALSIETDTTGAFPVHRALLGRGVVVLEGLLLDAIPEGPCELVCLPLRLRGGDGGPARALIAPR
jgi:arylformamidase